MGDLIATCVCRRAATWVGELDRRGRKIAISSKRCTCGRGRVTSRGCRAPARNASVRSHPGCGVGTRAQASRPIAAWSPHAGAETSRLTLAAALWLCALRSSLARRAAREGEATRGADPIGVLDGGDCGTDVTRAVFERQLGAWRDTRKLPRARAELQARTRDSYGKSCAGAAGRGAGSIRRRGQIRVSTPTRCRAAHRQCLGARRTAINVSVPPRARRGVRSPLRGLRAAALDASPAAVRRRAHRPRRTADAIAAQTPRPRVREPHRARRVRCAAVLSVTSPARKVARRRGCQRGCLGARPPIARISDRSGCLPNTTGALERRAAFSKARGRAQVERS